MGSRAVAAALAMALGSAGCGADGAAAPWHEPPATPAAAKRASLTRLLGQRLVVSLAGPTADADLLRAIRRGEVGGVVLYQVNTPDPRTTRRLTRSLQAAARAGGQTRLMIATDQEGGLVKRLHWAPPFRPPPELGRLGNAAARAEGARTGRALRAVGINVDLAPVADVPVSKKAVIVREHRQFGFTSARVSARATAFAAGLRAAGVEPVLKHFPGLGQARTNTDTAAQRLTGSRARRAAELRPFRTAFRAGAAHATMLAWATYPAYDAKRLAGASAPVIRTVLRRRAGLRGVAMTDSLAAQAPRRVAAAPRMAVTAARAGADLLSWSGAGTTWRPIARALDHAARTRALSRAGLEASYLRILAFKKRLARP